VKFSGSNLLPHLSQSAVGRWQVRVLQRFVRHIMILNPGMVEEAITAGLPRDHLLWMPNPVDVSAFVPKDAAERNALRASAGIGPDTMVALFLGRLAPEKQLSSLISAAAQLRTRFPDTLLAVAGDGPERAALEAQAKASDAPVRFLGRLNEDQVRGWMSISNGFTLVSSQEGFPVSLVEAMAMGLPSVVSDIPANAQLIDPGIHGLLVPVGDSTAIANALEHLWKDEALRHRMGTAARQRVVENYSTAQVIDRYEALFAEVLKTPPPAV
jgi:glycosyltransferase involved in cell wall biosynthesis